jgi:methyltransferase family protein
MDAACGSRSPMVFDFSPNSPANPFREKRFAWFLDLLANVSGRKGALKVLDVGGTMAYWSPRLDRLAGIDLQVTLLNRAVTPVSDPRFLSIAGDARDLSQFPNDGFDIIHSNSVIEHVGRWNDMMAMAKEIRRVAPAHFVQTPYFWFPIEPHFRTPFFHWMPESWRLRLAMSRRLGFWGKAPDVDSAMKQVQSAVLLDRKMYGVLFPDSEIRQEKFLALTKSLVAVRHGRAMS